MLNNKLKLNFLLIFFFSLSGLQAQENITTSGGNAWGSGGSVSYSVGQVVYTTNTGTNGSVAQGVQQPFEISVVSVSESALNISLSVFAYPNPTTNYLTLEVKDFELSTLNYQLFDMNGQLLKNEKITNNHTNIDMSNLLPATYFLKVIQANEIIKTFKIIKVQ